MYTHCIVYRVVEFRKVREDEAISPIGILTGIDPYLVYVKWQPDKSYFEDSEDPDRVGYHILTKMPGKPKPRTTLELEHTGHMFNPKKFEDGCGAIFEKCLNRVKQKYLSDSPVIESWVNWTDNYCPMNLTAEEYIAMKGWPNVPLEASFYSDFEVELPVWSLAAAEMIFEDPEFAFPPALAAAMPSVITRFNTHPPEPRIYVPNNESYQQILLRFDSRTETYYSSKILSHNLPYLSDILRNRNISNAGNKTQLIQKIKNNDRLYCAGQYRSLLPLDLNNLKVAMDAWSSTLEEYRQPFARIRLKNSSTACELSVGEFKQLNRNQIVSSELMDFLMVLNQQRDDEVLHSMPSGKSYNISTFYFTY